MRLPDLYPAIEAAIRAAVAPVALSDLAFQEDLDHDGEPILRVTAEFDDSTGTPTGAQMNAASLAVNGLLFEADLPYRPTIYATIGFPALSERGDEAA